MGKGVYDRLSLPVFIEEREGGVVERGGVIGVVIGWERGWGVG